MLPAAWPGSFLRGDLCQMPPNAAASCRTTRCYKGHRKGGLRPNSVLYQCPGSSEGHCTPGLSDCALLHSLQGWSAVMVQVGGLYLGVPKPAMLANSSWLPAAHRGCTVHCYCVPSDEIQASASTLPDSAQTGFISISQGRSHNALCCVRGACCSWEQRQWQVCVQDQKPSCRLRRTSVLLPRMPHWSHSSSLCSL